MTSAFATGPSTDDASGELESVLLQVSLALTLINYWQLRQREWGLIFVEQCTSNVDTVLKGKLTWTTLRLSEVKYPPSFVTPQPVKHWFEVYNCILLYSCDNLRTCILYFVFFVFLWQLENLRISLESTIESFVSLWQLENSPATVPSSSPAKLWAWDGRQTGGKVRRSTRSPSNSSKASFLWETLHLSLD